MHWPGCKPQEFGALAVCGAQGEAHVVGGQHVGAAGRRRPRIQSNNGPASASAGTESIVIAAITIDRTNDFARNI